MSILPQSQAYNMFLPLISLILLTCIHTAHAEENAGKARLQVDSPWARASIGKSRPSAAYLTITNHRPEAVSLKSVSSPVADKTEIHKMENSDGVMRMKPVNDLTIAAGETVKLAPGGLHVMLMQLEETLEEGDRFELRLSFQDVETITLNVPVLGPGAMKPDRE